MREFLREYWIPILIAAAGIGGLLIVRLFSAMGSAVKTEEDSDQH